MKYIKSFESINIIVEYKFDIGGENYQVEFQKLKNKWKLSYYIWDKDKWSVSKMTSNGNGLRVINEVFGKYLNKFIDNHNPKEILIEGLSKEKEKEYVSQRTKIYLRYLRKNTPNGWELLPKGDPINNTIKLKYIGNETRS